MIENQRIADRYHFEALLGRGGMAEVWRAHDERLERPVAIKLLGARFAADPEFLVRFFAEAQNIARITHPNVVGVLDFGQHDEKPYLVLEYVPGGAVSELTGDPVLPERAVEIVADAAAGAGAAHKLGIVHRDIKPANILICDDGRAKLVDFGIASLGGSERLTATGTAIGSPHYVSPEQASGQRCGPASDVYSLGVVLYELVAGRKPFEGDNITAIAIAHVEKTPQPPSALVPDLDPELDVIIMRCLAKDPADRYEDGSQLAAALKDPATGAALATSRALHEDDDSPWIVTEGSSMLQRLLTLAAVVVCLLVLASVAVWSANRDEATGPLSRDQETQDAGEPTASKNRQRKPDPKETGTQVSSFQPQPSPSATQAERGRDKPEPEPTGEPQPPPEPEPTSEPEPTPEPQPTPEPEPTPEPTSTGGP